MFGRQYKNWRIKMTKFELTANFSGTEEELACALEFTAKQLREGYRSGLEWDTVEIEVEDIGVIEDE
jgi:hypothetical protein